MKGGSQRVRSALAGGGGVCVCGGGVGGGGGGGGMLLLGINVNSGNNYKRRRITTKNTGKLGDLHKKQSSQPISRSGQHSERRGACSEAGGAAAVGGGGGRRLPCCLALRGSGGAPCAVGGGSGWHLRLCLCSGGGGAPRAAGRCARGGARFGGGGGGGARALAALARPAGGKREDRTREAEVRASKLKQTLPLAMLLEGPWQHNPGLHAPATDSGRGRWEVSSSGRLCCLSRVFFFSLRHGARAGTRPGGSASHRKHRSRGASRQRSGRGLPAPLPCRRLRRRRQLRGVTTDGRGGKVGLQLRPNRCGPALRHRSPGSSSGAAGAHGRSTDALGKGGPGCGSSGLGAGSRVCQACRQGRSGRLSRLRRSSRAEGRLRHGGALLHRLHAQRRSAAAAAGCWVLGGGGGGDARVCRLAGGCLGLLGRQRALGRLRLVGRGAGSGLSLPAALRFGRCAGRCGGGGDGSCCWLCAACRCKRRMRGKAGPLVGVGRKLPCTGGDAGQGGGMRGALQPGSCRRLQPAGMLRCAAGELVGTGGSAGQGGGMRGALQPGSCRHLQPAGVLRCAAGELVGTGGDAGHACAQQGAAWSMGDHSRGCPVGGGAHAAVSAFLPALEKRHRQLVA